MHSFPPSAELWSLKGIRMNTQVRVREQRDHDGHTHDVTGAQASRTIVSEAMMMTEKAVSIRLTRNSRAAVDREC